MVNFRQPGFLTEIRADFFIYLLEEVNAYLRRGAKVFHNLYHVWFV